MVERLEEVFVWHLDVAHPLKQILRPVIMDSKLDKLASDGHVCRTFGHAEAVWHRTLRRSACFMIDPRIPEPVREIVTANNLRDLHHNQYKAILCVTRATIV